MQGDTPARQTIYLADGHEEISCDAPNPHRILLTHAMCADKSFVGLKACARIRLSSMDCTTVMTLTNLMQPDLSQTSSSVGGRWLLSEDVYAVVNPATALSVAQSVRGGALQAQTAVDAAALARPTYRQTAMQLTGLLKA